MEKYWTSEKLNMPYGRDEYRWHGKLLSGWPDVVEFWNHDTNAWERCPNINVRQRIKNLGGNNGNV